MSEPTLGEVLRRLDEVSRQMQDLVRQMVEDRRENASTFVTKELYRDNHQNLTRRVNAIEHDAEAKEKAADAFRRQVLLLVIGLAIPAMVSLLLAVNNFLASGGQTP